MPVTPEMAKLAAMLDDPDDAIGVNAPPDTYFAECSCHAGKTAPDL